MNQEVPANRNGLQTDASRDMLIKSEMRTQSEQTAIGGTFTWRRLFTLRFKEKVLRGYPMFCSLNGLSQYRI